MTLVELTPPRPDDEPSALALSYAMCTQLATQQATGSTDLAQSVQQLFDTWANPFAARNTFAAVVDPDTLPAGATTLPMGIGAGEEDPTLEVWGRGFVDISVATDVDQPAVSAIDFTLADDLLPLPGQPLSQQAVAVLDELLAFADSHPTREQQVWAFLQDAPLPEELGCGDAGECDEDDADGEDAPADEPSPYATTGEYLASKGFRIGLEEHQSYLPVPRQKRDPQLPEGYQLHPMHSVTPDDPAYLQGVVDLFIYLDTDIPHGDLSVDPTHWTPPRLQALARHHQRAGREFAGALITCGEEVAALSLVTKEPSSLPYLASQGVTVVHPAHRRRGLGMAVKKAALNHVRAQFPGVTRVYTANAGINDGMLTINRQLGLVQAATTVCWVRTTRDTGS